MRLMYEDFGVVRENKEQIRHRVFVTKLKPGMQEEYKLRHDRLAEARNGKITQGPDSNFSIWNAGDYIFGYNRGDRRKPSGYHCLGDKNAGDYELVYRRCGLDHRASS